MKFKLLLIFFLFVSIKISFGQTDPVFTDKQADLFLFKYVESPSGKEKTSNYFIEELSKSIPKILAYTQYSFSFNYQISVSNSNKLLKPGKKECKISVEIKDGKCSGDVLYKGFSIADALLPDFVDFTISIKNGSEVVKQITAPAIIIHAGYGITSNITFQDSIADDKFKATLSNKIFYYNDSSKILFQKKIQLINDYYHSEFVIASALENIKYIDLENVEMIKVFDIKLNDVEKIIKELKSKAFSEKLNLQSGDPIDFLSKFNDITQKTQKQRVIINQMLATLDKVYYKKGIENAGKGDTISALKFFKKSIEINPYFSPAFYQMVKIYFGQNELDKASQNITTITVKLSPDQPTLKQVIQLGNNIFSKYLTNSETLINAEKFYEALEVLKKAKLFCDSTPAIACNEYIHKDIAKAKYGIYKSFITVSQKAIDKEIFDIAEIYILRAKDYQEKNFSEIISALEADDLLSQLVKKYTYSGLLLNSQLKFDTALIVLEKASELCKKYTEIKCSYNLAPAISTAKNGIYRSLIQKAAKYIQYGEPDKAENAIATAKAYQQSNSIEITTSLSTDSLTTLIKKQWYDKYISEGITNINYNNGEKALSDFEAAKLLEKTYAVKKDHRIDSLTIAAAKPFILKYIETASVNVWGNELDKAIQIQDSLKIIQAKYALTKDTTIQKAMADLKTKIFNQQCKNAQETYNEYYRNAYKKINLKKYSSADDLFLKCMKTGEDNSSCNIHDSTARAGKEKYLHAANYQKLIEESEILASSAKYYDAINKYIESEKYFTENNIRQFGLTHILLNDYLASHKDNNYIYQCANYFVDKNNYTNTFLFLEVLRNRNCPENSTKDIQEMLAQKLAAVDFAANNKQKPSSLINKNTGGIAWYNYFKKAYMKAWKELKKK
jgi:hypothetical protein